MKIAYLTSRNAPHHEPDVQQMLHTAAALRAQGIDIDVLLPRRWRQIFASRKSLTELVARHYNIPDNTLSLIPLPPVLGLPGRSSSETLDTVSTILADACALPPALFHSVRRYQMVYTRRWPMAAMATRLGQPTVFETYTAVSASLLRRYCNLDRLVGLVVHSHLAAGWLASEGLPEERIFVCHNGYNPDDLQPAATREQARCELGLSLDRSIACYAGRLKGRKAPEAIVEVARLTPEVLYILIGATGGEKDRLENDGNVVVLDWMEAARLRMYLYAADLLIIPPSSKPLESRRTVLPLKTFLYMAVGRPIIGPDQPDLREVLEHGRNAYLTTPDRPDEAAKAVRKLLSEPALGQRLAAAAVEDSQGFTWRERGRRLAGFLRSRSAVSV